MNDMSKTQNAAMAQLHTVNWRPLETLVRDLVEQTGRKDHAVRRSFDTLIANKVVLSRKIGERVFLRIRREGEEWKAKTIQPKGKRSFTVSRPKS